MAIVFALILAVSVPTDSQGQPDPDFVVYISLLYLNELEAPQSVIDQVTNHLIIIESSHSEVADLDCCKMWDPGHFKLWLTDPGWAEFLIGELHEVQDLATEYQCTPVHWDYQYKTVEYWSEPLYHSEILAGMFEGLPGVDIASAYPTVWTPGIGVTILELGAESRYLYWMGWGDCLMGCIYEHYWEFTVSDTEVLNVEEWGAVATEAETWGGVKALYR